MDLKRVRSLDKYAIEERTKEIIDEREQQRKRAEIFIAEKKVLEEKIEKVKNTDLSERKKKVVIAALEVAIDMNREQYEKEVVQEENRLRQEQAELHDDMKTGTQELGRIASDFRDIKLKESKTDASAAADEADVQKKEFEQMHQDYSEKDKELRRIAARHQEEMQRTYLSD